MNVDGRAVDCEEEIRNSLARQIDGPIQWQDCVREMWRFGSHVFVQLGPGRVLTGLIRETEPESEVFAIDGTTPIDGALEDLEGVLQYEGEG